MKTIRGFSTCATTMRRLAGCRFESRGDVFRYLPLLPVEAAGSGLAAGGTPLVEAPRIARAIGRSRRCT